MTITASPAGVGIQGQPTNAVLGQVIQPAVSMGEVDQSSNLVPGGHAPVTISIYSGPAHAKLVGKTTVRVVDGVATFSNLKLSKVGNYTLKVTSRGLTPDFSNVFTVAVKRKASGSSGHWLSTLFGQHYLSSDGAKTD